MSFDLSGHFTSFFSKLNPSPRFQTQAAREYAAVKAVLEKDCVLKPTCFLQGSYREHTAIHTINDVDIVVLCRLWHPPTAGSASSGWGRDAIFEAIVKPLLERAHYAKKVRYGPQSMCVKIDLGITLELLPVVYAVGNEDPTHEPFRLYRPSTREWSDGYARQHQAHLSKKNANCSGNFIPAIKVLKHLRSLLELSTVSFHIECLLYALPDGLYRGGPSEYIPAVLSHLARTPQASLASTTTPCGERYLFDSAEFDTERWQEFNFALAFWDGRAQSARSATTKREAVAYWRMLLGSDYFPERVA